MINRYHLITYWRVEGSAAEVYDLISTPLDYPRWWPSVYLSAEPTEPGSPGSSGQLIRFHTKGWLPYTISWKSHTTSAEHPHRFAIQAEGDFNGRGVWTFRQNGPMVDVMFDWQLTADKPLLRRLSFLLKPVFAANHRWAMARGLESLKLELARRRARTEPERNQIPLPPAPNKTSGLWLSAGAVALVAAVALRKRIPRP